jgi:hypothetical protein
MLARKARMKIEKDPDSGITRIELDDFQLQRLRR